MALSMKGRTELMNTITDNLMNVPDNDLSNIFDIINEAINRKKIKINKSRYIMMMSVKENLQYVDDEDIIDIENMIIVEKKIETKNETRIRVVLEIANVLLVSINMSKINDLCDFKNVPRSEILKDCCKDAINKKKEYIFNNYFSKIKCKMYQTKITNAHLSLFKGMLLQINCVLSSKIKCRTKNKVRTTQTMYFIEKNV